MHSETKQDSRGTAAIDALPHVWPEPPATGPTGLAEGTVHSYRRRQRRPTERLIAVTVAAAVHAGVIFGIRSSPAPEVKSVIEPEEVIMLEMPELEPPEMIEVVDVADSAAPPEMAPPSLMDMPSTVAVSAFLQPMQPQLDPSLTNVGAIKIPPMTGNFGQPGAAGIKLFDLKELDRVPRRTRTVVPVYPFELRRAGVMGEVVLLVIIDPSGHVEVERVISATHREFEVAAVKAAEQCMYESPLKGGQKVSARYTWSIPFMLQ